jgi:hypothetical protein
VAALAALAVALLPPGSARAALVVRTADPITAFAHDGSLIGYDTRPGACRFDRKQTTFGVRNMGSGARMSIRDQGGCVARIAVGTSQVIWNAPTASARSTTWTTTYGEIFPQPMRAFDGRQGLGTIPLGLASDGSVLVESWMRRDYRDRNACLAGGDCTKLVTGGGVEQISGYSRAGIPGTRPAVSVAVNGNLLALLPVVIGSVAQQPYDTDPIELRDVGSGALRATVSPPGTVISMAMGGGRLAVLVKLVSGAKQIRVYNPQTGALVVSHDVTSDVAAALDVSIAGVLYRRGAELRLAGLNAARQRRVATLSRVPRFISIEGTTIVYVIDGTSAGAIRRLAAPAV